jgi:hypothetical protein
MKHNSVSFMVSVVLESKPGLPGPFSSCLHKDSHLKAWPDRASTFKLT